MIDNELDLSDEDDVYANLPRCSQLQSSVAQYEMLVVSEAAPTALARVFGLLSSLDIVPHATSSSCQNDWSVRLNLQFKCIDHSTMDLLRRKASQLTETIDIRLNRHVLRAEQCLEES